MFLVYSNNVVARLGSNVTLECVADQPVLAWEVNNLQLLDRSIFNSLKNTGVIIGIGATESIPECSRTTLTIPATIPVNNSIDSIVYSAGPTEFDLQNGDIITFTVKIAWCT